MTFASRAGGWLFKRRSWLPLPLVAALLLVPPPASPSGPPAAALWIAGLLIVAAGEGLRLWGVHHIGAVSRTRSDRLGPLIAAGPFAYVRNPLYIGNILLWTGFAISARLLWLAPILVVLLALEYHAIVRWEEDLLHERMGEPYARYVAEVPRWLPSFVARTSTSQTAAAFSWKQTLFSERGTLIAIVLGIALLYLKLAFFVSRSSFL